MEIRRTIQLQQQLQQPKISLLSLPNEILFSITSYLVAERTVFFRNEKSWGLDITIPFFDRKIFHTIQISWDRPISTTTFLINHYFNDIAIQLLYEHNLFYFENLAALNLTMKLLPASVAKEILKIGFFHARTGGLEAITLARVSTTVTMQKLQLITVAEHRPFNYASEQQFFTSHANIQSRASGQPVPVSMRGSQWRKCKVPRKTRLKR